MLRRMLALGLVAAFAFACGDVSTEPIGPPEAPPLAVEPGLNGENLMHAQPPVTEPLSGVAKSPVRLAVSALSSVQVLEDFESAVWPYAAWVLEGFQCCGATSAAAAWQGVYGFIDPGAGWYRNTATNVGSPGDKIAIRTRFVSGRARTYLAFDATAAGAKSLVFASNTNDIRFQRNVGYGFQALTITPFAPVAGTWYKLELEFVNANDVVGRLYDETGAVLLATVAQTYAEGISPGNIGVRSFSSHQSDYITDETVIIVEIDIKPGSDPNSINLGAKGLIPVAILTTSVAAGESVDFDAADVDPATVTLGNDDGNDTPVAMRRNGSLFASLEDVDGDGDLDLSLKFDQPALEANGDLDASTTDLILNGQTFGGQAIQGSDAVRITPAS